MILAAALLVLLGLALFVGGILTDLTTLYWLCVATCGVAGILLVVARIRLGPPPGATEGRTGGSAPSRSPKTAELPSTAASATDRPAAARAGSGREPPSTSAAHLDAPRPDPAGDPPAEEVEVTDLLLVVDLDDEVLVVDEHPRYHLPRCRWLAGRATIPLPVVEARTDGFTPCGWCKPDRTLAERERGRRAGRRPE